VMAFLGSVGVGLCLIASLGKLFVEGLDRFLPLPEQIVDEGLFVRVKAIQSCGRETAMVKWRDGREAELGGEAGGGAGV